MTVEKTFAVTPTGVGRKDHSKNVEFATEAFVRSVQGRVFYDYRFTGLPGPPYPSCYEMPLGFLVDGVVQLPAPSRPYIFYLISGSTDRNALMGIAFNRYASVADYLASIIAEQYGGSRDYNKTHLQYTKGIPTIEGNVYSVFLAEWAGLPFNFNLVIHAMIGGVETL